MTIFIYALTDPMWLNVRYVGKSIDPRQRLINQCNEKSNTYRCHWIQSLVKQGMHPIQTFLEVLDDNANWQDREKYWISYFKSHGNKLVNCTDGGDGVVNLSGESKERILRTWKGRKHKPETLIKISLASKGRKHDDNWRKSMHDKMVNRDFSYETRLKISKSNSKLSDDDIDTIRFLLDNHISQYKIADLYHVHQGTISNIKLNKFYNGFSNIKN